MLKWRFVEDTVVLSILGGFKTVSEDHSIGIGAAHGKSENIAVQNGYDTDFCGLIYFYGNRRFTVEEE